MALRTVSVIAWCLVASSASAHIKLETPADWLTTDFLGDPQKSGPCGSTGPTSGETTTVIAGSTLHLKWKETIFHPGHFRIAIAADRSQLIDPVVTTSNGACISAAVQSPPVAPVVVDGLFDHTDRAADDTYETNIIVPSMTCDHCTLQVIQFMSSHGAPCLYYHCADLKIVPAQQLDGGVTVLATSPTLGMAHGCSAVDGAGFGATVLIAALWWLNRRKPSQLAD